MRVKVSPFFRITFKNFVLIDVSNYLLGHIYLGTLRKERRRKRYERTAELITYLSNNHYTFFYYFDTRNIYSQKCGCVRGDINRRRIYLFGDVINAEVICFTLHEELSLNVCQQLYVIYGTDTHFNWKCVSC